MTELYTGIAGAVIFALIGIAVFVGAFAALDKLTPFSLWKEILEEHNTALAIMIGGVSIAIAIIIAAAVN